MYEGVWLTGFCTLFWLIGPPPLSWFAVRIDWDSHQPASGYKKLVHEKYKIIESFGKKIQKVLF